MSTTVQPRIGRTSDGLLVVSLFNIPLKHDRTWDESIKAGGPNTYKDSDIWKVGKKYPSDKTGTETIPCISLVDFERSWKGPEGVELAKRQSLPLITPRQAFAIGEACPTLNRDLEREYLAVVSLETCEFGGGVRAPCVWFGGGGREASLGGFVSGWDVGDFVGLLGEVPLV